jgi:hypothetical protein
MVIGWWDGCQEAAGQKWLRGLALWLTRRLLIHEEFRSVIAWLSGR